LFPFLFDIVVHKKDGLSPAHCAASEGHTESLDALIAAGADINSLNKVVLYSSRFLFEIVFSIYVSLFNQVH
jgi:ankyrin repeat protein